MCEPKVLITVERATRKLKIIPSGADEDCLPTYN